MKLVQKVVIILTAICFFTCQTNDFDEVIFTDESNSFIQKIAVSNNEQASFLAGQLKGNHPNGRISSATLDSVVYYQDTETKLTNYAFLTSGDSIKEFSNVIFLQTDTSFVAYEVIYRPSEEHLNTFTTENIMFNFSGSMTYQSLETGEPFLTVNYENGLPITSSSNGRMPDNNTCYPDEAGRLECYTVYVTTNDDGSYTSSTTGVDYNNHNFGEPASPHTERYSSCMVVDKDFSTCNLTSFNTNGYTNYPQWHGGANTGSLNSGTTPVFEPISLEELIRQNKETHIEQELDPEKRRVIQLDYINEYGGRAGITFVDDIENIISTPGLTFGEVWDINNIVDSYYYNLKGEYLFVPFITVARTAKPFVELAIFEIGGGVLFQTLKVMLNARWGIQIAKIGTNVAKTLEEIILGIKSELSVSADLRSMQISIGGKTISGTSNSAKSTYNFTTATEAEAKAFFNKLTEGAKKTEMIIPNKGKVIRVGLSNGQFILLRNFATSGGDLTIQFSPTLINGTAEKLKFFF